MAFDKNRLLAELGNVVTQLQNADNGCMGKLFASPGQGYTPNAGQGYAPNPGQGYTPLGNPLPTCGGCRRGICPGHGYAVSRPSAGEPCAMNPYHMQGGHMHEGRLPTNGMQGVPVPGSGMHGGVMSGCYNTPYNMPGGGMPGGGMPVMQGNTMQGGGMQGGTMQGGGIQGAGMQGDGMGNMMKKMMGVSDDTNVPHMGGMGAHILNMMSSGGGGKPVNAPGTSGQLNDSMLIDAPHSPHGQVGVTPLTPPAGRGHAGRMGMNPGQPHVDNMGQGNPVTMMNPPTQYVSQDKTYSIPNPQGPAVTGNMPQNPGTQPLNYTVSNPAAQQMANTRHNYGPHTASMKKFNEIFPGVTQGLGDLNFDPMAIALQMNPANQQKKGANTVNKFLNNNQGLNSAMLQPTITGANAAAAALGQSKTVPPNTQLAAPPARQNIPPPRQVPQQQHNSGSVNQPNQQLVYRAVTGAPTMSQPAPQQQVPQQSISRQQVPQQQAPQQQMSQQNIDPNTRAGIIPEDDGKSVDPNAPVPGQMIKEPIFPVDTTKTYSTQPIYTYNTLGQPVELFPVTYHKATPNLPQTLDGSFRSDLRRGYDIKNTTSKTLLATTRPAGSTASRSQLQHVYRQYKASHSATQQNIKPPVQGGSLSEGRLNSAPVNVAPPQIPVENVGGDTAANNQISDKPTGKLEPERGQAGGDIVAANIAKDASRRYKEKIPGAIIQKRGRNGLQDQTYQPYSATAAWTFHG